MIKKYIGLGRAKCKKCGKLIDKGEIGLANTSNGGAWQINHKYHVACFRQMIDTEINRVIEKR